jgi:hypothetical protein
MVRSIRLLPRCALIISVLVSLAAVAQDLTSRVDGEVVDQTGARIPGVTVTLTNVDTNVSRTAVADHAGLYVFPQVPFGNYSVSAELSGFKKSVVEGVKVQVGLPTTVRLVLAVGGVTETVTVTSGEAQSVVNTVNAEINTIVDRPQIDSLPLNGRSVTELALLQAGVTGRGDIAREASVNGTRGTFNNFTLDGINNQDNFIRTDSFFGVIPLRESFIEEFNITTSNSEVDAGFGVSQTQMVTRSGTNRFHGGVYYVHKNEALNANSFFNNAQGIEKERERNHQYGGYVGGPIVRNKLFFFFNYEKEKDPSTVSVAREVLTAGTRQGDFTYRRGDNGQFQTVNLFQLGRVTPDSIVSSLIAQTPLPNDNSVGDGRNISGFRFNSPAESDQDWIVLRIDYEPAVRHSFTGTFHQFRFDQPNDPFNGIDAPFPGLPGAGQESTRRLGSYSWRAFFTPNLTNTLRYGFQWAPVDFVTSETFQRGYKIEFSDAAAGEVDLFVNPTQNFAPQGRNAPFHDFTDNATWVKGRHAFKFGGTYRRSKVDQFGEGGIIPEYILGFGAGNDDPLAVNLFPGGIAANDLSVASELLGILGGFIREGAQTFNVTSRTSGFVPGAREDRVLTQNFLSFYGGDTWKVLNSLTLTLGLRWEFHAVPDEKNGLILLPVGGVESVLDPNAVVDFAGGDARPLFKNDLNNFAPHIALAWQPFKNGKTVIRGGYGINYVVDNNFTAALNAFVGNDGLSQGVALTGVSGTLSRGVPAIPIPTFKIPRTARDGILLDPQAALYTIDPNLRTPYVQQYTIGIQHEIFRDTALEVRYVGNHGVKLGRAVDLNQAFFPSEFVDDFRRAQRNLVTNGNPAVGERLVVFPQLGLGGFLENSTVRTYIRNGEIGQYVGGLLAPNRDFFFRGEGGEEFGATLPISYFYPNPNAYVGDFLGNNAFSKYNSLQIELRRRFQSGFIGQFNYTWGKVLTDFSGSQTNFRGLFDNAQPNLEIMRPDYDITHTFNSNFVWELPFGSGRKFMNDNRFLDPVLGGWDLTGIIRAHSGETVNIFSGRGTINRGGTRALTNTVHLLGMTIPELQGMTGAFRQPDGRVLLFDPSLIGSDGRANPANFQNPGLLQAGSLGMSAISGPWYSTVDMGVRKSFKLPFSEDTRIQFRFDIFNLFNHTNFNITSQPPSGALDDLGVFNRQGINSTAFGLIDDTFSPRNMQVALKILF